jgi:hypothetical protein
MIQRAKRISGLPCRQETRLPRPRFGGARDDVYARAFEFAVRKCALESRPKPVNFNAPNESYFRDIVNDSIFDFNA